MEAGHHPELNMPENLPGFSDLPCSERMALWTIRRLAIPTEHECTTHMAGDRTFLTLPCFRRDFAPAANAMKNALTLTRQMLGSQTIGLPSALTITAEEWHILQATSASQSGQMQEMLLTLKKMLTHSDALFLFSDALTQLGACLAGAGYWLSTKLYSTALSGKMAPHRSHFQNSLRIAPFIAAHAVGKAHSRILTVMR